MIRELQVGKEAGASSIFSWRVRDVLPPSCHARASSFRRMPWQTGKFELRQRLRNPQVHLVFPPLQPAEETGEAAKFRSGTPSRISRSAPASDRKRDIDWNVVVAARASSSSSSCL